MQPSIGCSEGRQLESPRVSKQGCSAATQPQAAKPRSRRRAAAPSAKQVTFADCLGEDAGAEQLPACSKPSARHSHSRAVRRRRTSPAAEAVPPPHKLSLVPDTYTELDGAQQSRAEGTKGAGQRSKRRRSARSGEDRRFIEQFAAEAGALLGSASGSQRRAADSGPQDRCVSQEAPHIKEGHASGHSIGLSGEPAAKEPVLGDIPARQDSASTEAFRAPEEEPPAASPNYSKPPAGEQGGCSTNFARSSSRPSGTQSVQATPEPVRISHCRSCKAGDAR